MIFSRRRRPHSTSPHHFLQLSLCLLWWTLLTGLILFVHPGTIQNTFFPGDYFPALFLVILSFGWPLGVLRHHLLKGLLWGFFLALFLLLRLHHLGQWWNGLLLFVFLIIIEIYWRTSADHQPIS